MRFKHFHYIFILSMLCCTIGLNSCKKKCSDARNPDCENYDPCYGIVSANADFYIYELLGNSKTNDTMLTESDTIYAHNSIYIVPKYQNDSFVWELGTEVIRNKTLIRSGFPSNSFITVKLIVKKNSICLDKKLQTDTVVKRFYVENLYESENDTNSAFKCPFWGTWRGKNINTVEDDFLISFGYLTNNKIFINQSKPYVLAGLPRGNWPQLKLYNDQESICLGGDNYIGYKSMFRIFPQFDGIQGSFALKYKARIDNKYKIRIDYSFNETSYIDWLNGAQFPNGTPAKMKNNVWEGLKISNKLLK